MRVDVTFLQMSASKALRAYAGERLGRLERLIDSPIAVRLSLGMQGYEHVADAAVQADGITLTARESSSVDMYAAVDMVADSLAAKAPGNL